MGFPEPRRSRVLLLTWVVAAFAISAVTDLRVLAAAALACLALFPRGSGRLLRRVALGVLPFTLALTAAGAAWQAWVLSGPPPWAALAALNLRAGVIAFATFSVLARVDLFRALEPWPWLGRLVAVTLAQIQALRRLAVESRLALRSRMPRRPRSRHVIKGAGTITGTLFTLAARNSQDVSDALRSRGL